MNVEVKPDGGATVELGPQELIAFRNCINETLEAIDDWEFSTRVGVDRSVVEAMRGKVVSSS